MLVGIAPRRFWDIVPFAYQGTTYTSREEIIDIGPIQATASELSEMVGTTTRQRISLFAQRFRTLGLIETNLDRFRKLMKRNSPIIWLGSP